MLRNVDGKVEGSNSERPALDFPAPAGSYPPLEELSDQWKGCIQTVELHSHHGSVSEELA